MIGGAALTSKKGESGGHLRRSNNSNNNSNDSGLGMENGLYYQQTDTWVTVNVNINSASTFWCWKSLSLTLYFFFSELNVVLQNWITHSSSNEKPKFNHDSQLSVCVLKSFNIILINVPLNFSFEIVKISKKILYNMYFYRSDTKILNLKRSNYCEQDSGISSPHSNRDNSTITEKGTDSGSSICESCSCAPSGKTKPVFVLNTYLTYRWYKSINDEVVIYLKLLFNLCFFVDFFQTDCQINQSHNSNGGNNQSGGDFDFSAQKQKQIITNSEQQESNSTSSNEEDVDPKR